MLILMCYNDYGTYVPPRSKGELKMKEEYKKKIAELLEKCNDLSILDFILQLLQKSR